MRLAVVSDIHSNIAAFEEVLAEIDAERVICAGDLVGYYLHPGEVVDVIQQRDITSVRGNHDHSAVDWQPRNFNPVARKALELNREKLDDGKLSFLGQLPVRRELEVDGRDLLMVHGSPREPSRYVYPRDVDSGFLEKQGVEGKDIVVMGHTHVPLVEKIGGTLVLNPGSVGQPRDGDPRASYAVVDTDGLEATVERVEYDVESVVEEVEKSELPSPVVERLRDGR